MQITPVMQPVISTQNIHKAVAKAQRQGDRNSSHVLGNLVANALTYR